MTLELNHPELEAPAPQIKPQHFQPRPCPYFFFEEEEDDFKYFKW
jgi:hypothetical protein